MENANKFKEQSEAKARECEVILRELEKKFQKYILIKNILDKDIQSKKEAMEKEIERISKAQKEFQNLKKILYPLFKIFQEVLYRVSLKVSQAINLMKAVSRQQLKILQKKILINIYDH